jgi:hypothetical protein
VLFAIDHTSELLNPGRKPYKVLESFNLAVAVTIMPNSADSAAHWFQVWRVDAVTGRPDQEESPRLQALQRLSFFEDAGLIINDISIHGIHFAYCLSYPPGTTIIVDWRSANDEKVATDDPDIWYLGTTTVSVSCAVKLLAIGG